MKKINLKNILKTFRRVILILNIILLSSNIFLYYLLKVKNVSEKLFKFSDYLIMYLNIKSYKKISKHLTDKYYINFGSSRSSNSKKEIKIKSIGFPDKSHIKWLNCKLNDEFILKFEEDNPDYLIYNVFTKEDFHYKYNNSIKIAFYTENYMPDLNLADYIIGHYHISYLDRYFKYSIFFWTNFKDIDEKRKTLLEKPIRKKFCAAVISNCGNKFSEFRMDFIKKLSEYKKVDMGGKCQNNLNGNIKNKVDFLSNYKFSIAMENSNGDGYLSEKIVDSFLAGTIPIYYGDYILDEFINPKSYILIKGEKDIEKKINYIKKIDNDDDLYKSIIKEKPIIDDNFANKIDELEINSFLKNIFRQEKNKAFRRDDNYYDFNATYIILYFDIKCLLVLFLLF